MVVNVCYWKKLVLFYLVKGIKIEFLMNYFFIYSSKWVC